MEKVYFYLEKEIATPRYEIHGRDIEEVMPVPSPLVRGGVHGVLDESRIARILLDDEDPGAIAHGAIKAALARGSLDNCTAVVARYSM